MPHPSDLSAWSGCRLALLTLVACSPGIGRPPAYPDADITKEDGGARDVGIDLGFLDATLDAGRPDGTFDDATVIVLPDSGPQPTFPLTGIFRTRDGALVYTREINHQVSFVIDEQPYVYLGVIDDEGRFDAVSPSLLRDGCLEARVRGQFDRSGTILTFEHRSCRLDGTPFTANITATFAQDFAASFSGVYELQITNILDPNGCLTEQPGHPRWGVNLLEAARIVEIHVAVDPTPAVYIGSFDPGSRTLSALHRLGASPSPSDPSLRMQFQQISLNDPLSVVGDRDVIDVDRGCGYNVEFEGVRVEAP